MKKLFYSAAVMALAFFAGSCQQENLEPVQSGSNTVTYTVQVPGAGATKASNGVYEGVTELVYEVYRQDDVEDLTKEPVYEDVVRLEDGKTTWTLDLEFVKDQYFTVLFWAQNPDGGIYNTEDLRKVSLNNPEGLEANADTYAAFAGADLVEDCVSTANGNVILVRPVSQINIATSIEGLAVGTTPIDITHSEVVVTGLSAVYNVADGTVSGAHELAYSKASVPGGELDANHTYVAKNYVGFAPMVGDNAEVSFKIYTSEGEIDHVVSNVPVKPNYRTNIVGNLITANEDYNIELDPSWNELGNTEVVSEGIIRNINGDYEVTSARGLAYAINNLFVADADFYLTSELYDMSEYAVTPPTVPAGVTINIYGETPVVTRSIALGGVTITGLNGALIGAVAQGAEVSISGVNLPEAESVLVGKNDGTLIVYETTANELVQEGNAPVAASAITTSEELVAALAAGAQEVKLANDIEAINDIEAEKILMVSKSVVINGNGKSLKTSANRAIRITASNIDVVINDLNIVSTANVVYPSDVRGVSIDGSLANVDLTLNNCSIDFTDITTCDWTYAVNVSGSGTGHKVTVIGGSYEGANVVNAHGAKNIITVKNATLTSKYPFSTQYWGSCIWVLQNQGSSVYAEGNIFEGNNAIAFNLGDGTDLEEKNNVDNTMFYYSGAYYVTTVEKLQNLVNTLTESATIKFENDLAGDVTILQKEGVNLVIDGEGCKFDGTITVDGNNRDKGAETLKITNINFESATPKIFVSAPATINGKNERYSHNITVEGCSFSIPVYSEAAAAINAQKTYHLAVKNCTAQNMHSLLQVQSCDNDVLVDGVTVTNCKSGVSFGNTKNVTLQNSTISASVYGVRADATDARECVLDVKNTTVKAGIPVVVRKLTSVAKKYTVNLDEAVALTPANGIDVVFTKNSEETVLETPEGPWAINGAEALNVYPVDAFASTQDELVAALKAAKEGTTIKLLADITVSENWDARYTGAKITVPVVIDGLNHTLKFTNTVYDGGNHFSVFRFENDAEVRNLKFDLSEAVGTMNRFRAISAKTNLVVDNCEFIGNSEVTNSRAIIFGEGQSKTYDASVSVTNCKFVDWRRGVTDNENASDVKEVFVNNNTFNNASVALSAYETVQFNGNNLSGADVKIVSYTASSTVSVTALDNVLSVNGLYEIEAANVNAQKGFIVTAE